MFYIFSVWKKLFCHVWKTIHKEVCWWGFLLSITAHSMSCGRQKMNYTFLFPVINTSNLFDYHCKAYKKNQLKYLTCSGEHISKPSALQQR